MRLHAEAHQALLQFGVGGQFGHLAGPDHAAVIRDVGGVAKRFGYSEVLLHQQDRSALVCELLMARAMVVMIAGARPLVGSSIR